MFSIGGTGRQHCYMAHRSALSWPSPHRGKPCPKTLHGNARAPPITGPRMAPNPYAVPR